MTREEEIIRIAKKLDKMVSRNNTEGAIDLLKELKGFNMTLKVLQETRIGMSVNGIRKHSTDEEVIALAKFLIKDWKRLLESGHNEKEVEPKNGLNSVRSASPPHTSPPQTQSRKLDEKHDSDTDKKHFVINRKEKLNSEHKIKKIETNEKHLAFHLNETHSAESKQKKHFEEVKKQSQQETNCTRHLPEPQGDKHRPDLKKERPLDEYKVMKKEEAQRREKQHEVLKKHHSADDMKKRREDHGYRDRTGTETHRDKPADPHKPLFERKGVMDSAILYPSRYPSPPRPARPTLTIKRPSQDSKKDRKDKDKDSQKHSHVSKASSPPVRRPSLEIKRMCPPDPNAPIAPLPFHLHPPPPRKEPPDPNAPLPPLPLHLHPPSATKRLSQDGKKDRKESSDKSSQMKMSEDVKKDRKESSESKVSKKHKGEAKKERLACPKTESNDSVKKPSVDVKKELQRRESSDSKPGHAQKRPSTDSKPDRRESTDSKRSSSPPAKKLSSERRESLGSKSSVQSGPPQRKQSTDSNDRKSRVEVPKTPTTPTSPMSPGFASGGPLSPHLCTGDSVRDKCIEMISAALRTDDDFKVFGVNCDSMAAEIEDYIYQDIKATDMKYKNRVRSRISNLKDPKNPGLRKNVLAGSIDLHRIASMSAEEMASDELKQLRNVLTQEAIREHQMAKTGGTTTDLLQCGKCKKKNCTYNQVQTRSADEPMTTFVLCNECGNRWKFC